MPNKHRKKMSVVAHVDAPWHTIFGTCISCEDAMYEKVWLDSKIKESYNSQITVLMQTQTPEQW